MQLRPRMDVLPAQVEPHQVLRRDRLDLSPQASQREAVDAREKRPLAPLDHMLRRPASATGDAANPLLQLAFTGGEMTAQDGAFALELRQGDLHVRHLES